MAAATHAVAQVTTAAVKRRCVQAEALAAAVSAVVGRGGVRGS